MLFINPKECVKVASRSSIFYPLDGKNEQLLPLYNSIVFVSQNLKEDITSFSAGDNVVVLRMQNEILFYIHSRKDISQGLLHSLLNIICRITIFLFGPNFQDVMNNNIRQSLVETFSKYIEKYFELCNSDHKYLLMISEFDNTMPSLVEFIQNNNPLNHQPIDSSFVECILFKDSKIVGRFQNQQNSNSKLDQKDLFTLSLLVSTSNSDESQNFEKKKKLKRAFFFFNNSPPESCFVSDCELGDNSPFELIFIFKNSERTDEIEKQITALIPQFASLVEQFDSPTIPTSIHITGLLHYLLINRSTGQYFEMLKPSVAYPIFTHIQRTMAAVASEAIQNGLVFVSKNYMKFQYIYELRFHNKKTGDLIIPNGKINIPVNEISYSKIVQKLFGGNSSIQCFELLTIYLGVMNTKDVLHANTHIFKKLLS